MKAFTTNAARILRPDTPVRRAISYGAHMGRALSSLLSSPQKGRRGRKENAGCVGGPGRRWKGAGFSLCLDGAHFCPSVYFYQLKAHSHTYGSLRPPISVYLEDEHLVTCYSELRTGNKACCVYRVGSRETADLQLNTQTANTHNLPGSREHNAGD